MKAEERANEIIIYLDGSQLTKTRAALRATIAAQIQSAEREAIERALNMAAEHNFRGCLDPANDGRVYCGCGEAMQEDYREGLAYAIKSWRDHICALKEKV